MHEHSKQSVLFQVLRKRKKELFIHETILILPSNLKHATSFKPAKEQEYRSRESEHVIQNKISNIITTK